MVEHRGDEALHAVEHAEQIDAEHCVPDVGIGEYVAARTDPGIVHQQRHIAVLRDDPAGEREHRRAVRHVHGMRDRAVNRRGGGLERLARAVDQHDAHPRRRKGARGGEADPARRAGDDGKVARRDRRKRGRAHWSTVAIETAG